MSAGYLWSLAFKILIFLSLNLTFANIVTFVNLNKSLLPSAIKIIKEIKYILIISLSLCL